MIYLKEGSQKLMIINRGPIVDIDNQKYIFDYSGYSDQDEMRFQELFKEMKNNLDDDIQQGIVQKQDNLGLI
ncbi:MAG: hypothetical protein E6755_12830 [Staphylococcus epidermidis]|nr:hypothetical protein [Staphylococcus epidermidis]